MFVSATCWDRRNRKDLIESATPCHETQVADLTMGLNPVHMSNLAVKSED